MLKNAAKRLRIGISYGNLIDLPPTSSGWQPTEQAYFEAVAAAGYEGVQGGSGALLPMPLELALFGNGVVRKVRDAHAFARSWHERGAIAAGCIAGFGYESDREADRIVEAIREASDDTGLPIYIETHRASLTQDTWRSLRLLERHPDLRLLGDFSHWFTGLEMPAMDLDTHLRLLAPVFKSVHMLHGRIGDACCMQVPLADVDDILAAPFRAIWGEVMLAFANDAEGPDDLWFFPELLGTTYQYARVFQGEEESDRWQQAQILTEIAAQCARKAGLAVSTASR